MTRNDESGKRVGEEQVQHDAVRGLQRSPASSGIGHVALTRCRPFRKPGRSRKSFCPQPVPAGAVSDGPASSGPVHARMTVRSIDFRDFLSKILTS